MAHSRALRSPLAVTLGVWRALILREAVARLSQDRIAWLWIFVEPIAHIALLMWVFAIGLRTRTVAGADVALFILLGVQGFFLARSIMMRGMDAVESGGSLYAFRQLKPVDTVIARSVTEGLLALVLLGLMLVGAALFGLPVLPADPLGALAALGALAGLGLGLGLTFSVLGKLVPEFGRLVRLLVTPLYLFSGVLFPSVVVPVTMREVLLFNPFIHGIEALRLAFMPAYQLPPGIDLAYPAAWGVVFVFLGLALHTRFQSSMVGE